jgi:hypothetical protein
MLTQYNELRAARGKSVGTAGSGGNSINSSAYGNENSVNYSNNSMYGYGTDDNLESYYYGGGVGLSPQIAMRSPLYPGSEDSAGLKRKKRSGGNLEGDMDRLAGSGLLDIPEHLLDAAGRISNISDGKCFYVAS